MATSFFGIISIYEFVKGKVEGMEHLRCVVERITYQNEENGYAVIKCLAKGFNDLVTVVGNMPDVHVGSVLYLGGTWRINGKYGRQFQMETFEETLPATVYGIEKYLGSGLVKGIGPKFAKRIVQKFGKDTLEVIETDPDKLLEVYGIGQTRVNRIKKSWQEQKEIKNIMLFLQGHDVSTSHATKIYKTYGDKSIEVVQENPYRLADDIWGIGFKTADTIATKLGFGHEKYVRLRSGMLYTLNQLSDDGHCYATRDMLLKTGAEMLDVEDSLLSMALDEMIRAEDVIIEDIPAKEEEVPKEKAIYLPPFYYSEVGVARRLNDILHNTGGIRINPEGLRPEARVPARLRPLWVSLRHSGRPGRASCWRLPRAGRRNGCRRLPGWKRRPSTGCWRPSRRKVINAMTRTRWKAMC